MVNSDLLVKLVQIGPTGAGLAFALLGFWLLASEQRLVDRNKEPIEPRHALLSATRFFISIALLFFTIGTLASLVTVFADRIIRQNSQTISSALGSNLSTAEISEWSVDSQEKQATFQIRLKDLDLARYIPNREKSSYKLVMAIRPKSSQPAMAGSYPIVRGYFDYGDVSTSAVDDKTSDAAVFSTGCLEMSLFRISKNDAEKRPRLTEPFSPQDLGSSVKLLYTVFGERCP